MKSIRTATLNFLIQHHGTTVDRVIAHALITYCLVREDRRRKAILTWLAGGYGLDEAEASQLGLPHLWVPIEESAGSVELIKLREGQAFEALCTLGILSTYYQPLILAFDQLEGLRGDEELTTHGATYFCAN